MLDNFGNKILKKPVIYLVYFLIFFISFLIAYIFLLHQQNGMLLIADNKGDAGKYIWISQNLLRGMSDGVRTYAYPLFLKLIRYPYSSNNNELQLFSFYILLVQYCIYAASVLFFSFAITKSQKIRFFICSALLLQINILSFLSVTLSDILSLCFLLIGLGIFFALKKGSLRSFLLGLCTAFSIEIRPANLWVYGLIFVMLMLEFIRYKDDYGYILRQLLFFILGSLISFAPQIFYNWFFFRSFTPLPAGDLAQEQYNLSKEYLFVAFSTIPNDTSSLVRNPFFISSAYEFVWFSINGLSYALLKIMMMFHHTDLFVYQSISEFHQKIMIFFSSTMTYFGLLGVLFQYKNIAIEKRQAIILGMLFCILLHLNTRLEDRYTFAICLLLSPFAFYQVICFLKAKKYSYLLGFIPFFLLANLFNSVIVSLNPNYIPPDATIYRSTR